MALPSRTQCLLIHGEAKASFSPIQTSWMMETKNPVFVNVQTTWSDLLPSEKVANSTKLWSDVLIRLIWSIIASSPKVPAVLVAFSRSSPRVRAIE